MKLPLLLDQLWSSNLLSQREMLFNCMPQQRV